eukprot:CAMPEP_0119324392 /NCGR_PEP_ID=MMETSP1333-20130426/63090_1 /TAXON_ID=418940 /ORGANISM="Scyphosphaera apsteinii, Strain RCC1455" /LENGTH=155 /DNA_ID=CAMNT_0007332079 /DNA_START=13 /DNA_END=477 /DNA_ORIENTATION=-
MTVVPKIAAVAFGSHAALSFASIGAGTFFTRSRAKWPSSSQALSTPTAHQSNICKIVAGIYSGLGINPTLCTNDITFEDPVALCCGPAEVVEAFRALRAAHPEHVVQPRLHVHTDDPYSAVILMHQRYFGWLVVHSTLHVRFEPTGHISGLEERW